MKTKLKQPKCAGFTGLHDWTIQNKTPNGELYQCQKCKTVLKLPLSLKGELPLGTKKEHYQLFRRDFLQPNSWEFHAEYQ